MCIYNLLIYLYIYGIKSARDIQKQQQKHGGLAHISRVISLSWFMLTRVELIFRWSISSRVFEANNRPPLGPTCIRIMSLVVAKKKRDTTGTVNKALFASKLDGGGSKRMKLSILVGWTSIYIATTGPTNSAHAFLSELGSQFLAEEVWATAIPNWIQSGPKSSDGNGNTQICSDD